MVIHCEEVSPPREPRSMATTSPPAALTRSITSSWTRMLRKRRVNSEATTTSAWPASTALTAAPSPGLLSSARPPETSISS